MPHLFSTSVEAAATLVEAARQLPAAPQVLAEVNELLLDPHLQLEDVVRVLRRDSTLTSGIVRVANSALYAGTEPVGSIEDAVARLGIREVFRATGLAVTAQYGALALPTYGVGAGGVIRMSLTHAVAMESLCPFVGDDPLIGYTTGLVRALGLLVIDRVVRAQAGEAGPRVGAADRTAKEREWLGMTSAEVSALVLEVWKFAPQVVEAVRQQHLPGGVETASRLALTLNVAGFIVGRLGAAVPSEGESWQLTDEKLTRLGLTSEQLELVLAHTGRETQRLLAVLG